MDLQKGIISPHRLSDILHVSLFDLSKLTQLHYNALICNPESLEVQQRLGKVAQIVTIATNLLGDRQHVII